MLDALTPADHDNIACGFDVTRVGGQSWYFGNHRKIDGFLKEPMSVTADRAIVELPAGAPVKAHRVTLVRDGYPTDVEGWIVRVEGLALGTLQLGVLPIGHVEVPDA